MVGGTARCGALHARPGRLWVNPGRVYGGNGTGDLRSPAGDRDPGPPLPDPRGLGSAISVRISPGTCCPGAPFTRREHEANMDRHGNLGGTIDVVRGVVRGLGRPGDGGEVNMPLSTYIENARQLPIDQLQLRCVDVVSDYLDCLHHRNERQLMRSWECLSAHKGEIVRRLGLPAGSAAWNVAVEEAAFRLALVFEAGRLQNLVNELRIQQQQTANT